MHHAQSFRFAESPEEKAAAKFYEQSEAQFRKTWLRSDVAGSLGEIRDYFSCMVHAGILSTPISDLHYGADFTYKNLMHVESRVSLLIAVLENGHS
jgi:hypothetical protein